MIGAPVQRLGNGARTNPDITGSTNVAFDHGVQFGGNPNGGLTEDMIVPAGHTVLKSVGMETGVAVGSSDDDRNRNGVMKQWSVLHVLPARPPADSEVLPGTENPNEQWLVEKRVLVSGEDLIDAQPGFDQRSNEPVVTFRFNSNGARRFATATTQNVGRPFAIVLDNKVISAPRINEPITGGSGQISGQFTVETANNLSILLRAGALPAPLTIVEERTVGPGLGRDSIEAGTKATIYAAIFVVLFMFATYGVFGFIANIALIVHVGLILGIMSLLGATMTLPGIAGIVLTIGTAVDSNVLIYERIREEFRAGRSVVTAIQAGFERAFATIIDSNSTMFIAALILFLMGSGPVKGFAVVFILGVLTTVVTAVTLTRMMIATWYRWTRAKAIPF